jgi:hypothetical protein
MSKAGLVLLAVLALAACAPKPEPVAPIAAEPVYTGKY